MSAPAEWNIATDGPPQQFLRLWCDGEEVTMATAYSVPEGWVDAFCIYPDCPLNPHGEARTHANHARDGACEAPRRWGTVKVEVIAS